MLAFANTSRRSRWVVGSIRPMEACWPWISSRQAPNFRKALTEASASLTKARLLPSKPMERRNTIRPSSAGGRSNSCNKTCAGWPCSISNTAVACARCAPFRTKPRSARSPKARPRASNKMDFPAPVSPVRAVKPASISKSSASMMTTSRIERTLNMLERTRHWFYRRCLASGSFAGLGLCRSWRLWQFFKSALWPQDLLEETTTLRL